VLEARNTNYTMKKYEDEFREFKEQGQKLEQLLEAAQPLSMLVGGSIMRNASVEPRRSWAQ
jgi:hypothetical protein